MFLDRCSEMVPGIICLSLFNDVTILYGLYYAINMSYTGFWYK